jgi:hypothetical protein
MMGMVGMNGEVCHELCGGHGVCGHDGEKAIRGYSVF